MLKKIISIALGLMAYLLACVSLAAEQSSSLTGSWALVDGEYVDAEGTLIQYRDRKMSAIKVLSDGNYSFIAKAGEEFWAASAGTFTADGKTYSEQPEMTSYPLEPGHVYTFDYRLEGDDWYTERFEAGKRVEFEHWQRR